MGKAGAARKLAAAAAFGGGGLSVVGASLYGVLRAEAVIARRQIGDAVGEPPDSTGWYGMGRPGPAIKIALLGDSSAAGYGVESVQDTPGAHLASGLAEGAGRRVYLRSVAFVGAQTRDLSRQIDKALTIEPHAAVIMVGANDVTHSRLPSESVRLLEAAVLRLREAGTEVVVGTCPDLGTIEPIAPPLKQVARLWSRRLAAAQTIATVEAGGRTVSLGSVLGPEFAATPALFFGPDRFHPSAAGYSTLASVLLPSVLAAVGVIPFEDLVPEAARGEAILPISEAAVEAARTPGTEIDGTHIGGSARGARGRWVQLRRRRRQPESDVETPQSSETDPHVQA
ncbi:SGNH/GDSL hydrolase family protein [Nocardioides panacis]|uniref:SGNH/GDSL hydrolase family protein n=1 Tax=Nocardioides panacis TaxID=2849501 RepID=A0A975SYP2_9ACTN|nr:SGNH/GDSL hydrolase family protein [Nocardioides panacis]